MKSFFRAVAGLKASGVLLFVLLTMSVLLGGCFGDEKDQKAAVQAMPVNVIKVTEHQFPVMGEYVAQIQALKTVDIKARVQGHIKERLFTEGQRVKEGELLFVIDPRPYSEALKKAEAELASTQATPC